MDSIADFFSKEEQIKVLTGKLNDSALLISDLKVENENLKVRNLSLSKSNKSLNDKCVRAAISRDKLKGRHKRTALVVSELYVDGFLSLISQTAVSIMDKTPCLIRTPPIVLKTLSKIVALYTLDSRSSFDE